MRHLVSMLTVFLFFIWILPLGFFIKPSQEKVACNGQRAICLCSHLVAKQAVKNVGKMIYKNGGGSHQKENNGSGGSSHHYLLAQRMNSFSQKIFSYHQQQSVLYSLIVVNPVEHVPKA